VISIARLRPEKGHALLLQSFATVQREIPHARLRLVGDGPLAHELQDEAAALGIQDQVDFVGATNDVWTQLRQANVFALASQSETLGIALLEAMAAGLPVVATAVGGIPELIKPGRNGELVPPNDHAAMAEALVALLSNPSQREAYGREGRRDAANYTVEKAVARYFDLYDRLISDR
jgi:glycosyltransferase involved in cell wall biosynthesis